MKGFKYRNIIILCVITLCVVYSCNNAVKQKNATHNESKTIYPQQIVKEHLEKQYDNAVWLLYASNYHQGAHCYSRHGQKDTLITSLEPDLYRIIEYGDTTELIIFFAITKDSCACHPRQSTLFYSFGFFRQSDSIIYRKISGEALTKAVHGNMWNKIDSMKMSKSLTSSKQVLNFFGRADGYYPIDEQDSLFRIYVREHRGELSSTLYRLCKEKGVF